MSTVQPALPDVLKDMLATGRSGGVTVHSNIGRQTAEALQRVTADRQPALSIEVGMAFGFSTLAILGGTGGDVVSIDPFQLDEAEYAGAGVHAVERAGLSARHRLIAKPSYLALPKLIEDGVRVQFAYIDGMHTFDYVLVDFFLIDKLLDVGGVVAFNDCWLPSVHRAIRCARTHRSYMEIDTGLPKEYPHGWRVPLLALRDRLVGHYAQDRYFEKMSAVEPAWDFYAPF